MVYEKKKILAYRLVSALIVLLSIIIPTIASDINSKNLVLVEDNGYIDYYYEYINSSSCTIELTFNHDVEPGYATVAFYDADGKLLEQESGYFYGDGKTVSSKFYSISGKVDSYEIIDYEIEAYTDTVIFVIVGLIAFCFFIDSLFLSCKVYSFQGKEIIVYAGNFHNYIKVDNTKVDEHNTLIRYSAIYLSCTLDDGTTLDATITLMKRISLKINNKLCTLTN